MYMGRRDIASGRAWKNRDGKTGCLRSARFAIKKARLKRAVLSGDRFDYRVIGL